MIESSRTSRVDELRRTMTVSEGDSDEQNEAMYLLEKRHRLATSDRIDKIPNRLSDLVTDHVTELRNETESNRDTTVDERLYRIHQEHQRRSSREIQRQNDVVEIVS